MTDHRPTVVVFHERFPIYAEWPWCITCDGCSADVPGWSDMYSAQAGGYAHLRKVHPGWNDDGPYGTSGHVTIRTVD